MTSASISPDSRHGDSSLRPSIRSAPGSAITSPATFGALDVGTPGLDLIRTIPELDVEFIDRGCSGMAGTFGLVATTSGPHSAPGGPY